MVQFEFGIVDGERVNVRDTQVNSRATCEGCGGAMVHKLLSHYGTHFYAHLSGACPNPPGYRPISRLHEHVVRALLSMRRVAVPACHRVVTQKGLLYLVFKVAEMPAHERRIISATANEQANPTRRRPDVTWTLEDDTKLHVEVVVTNPSSSKKRVEMQNEGQCALQIKPPGYFLDLSLDELAAMLSQPNEHLIWLVSEGYEPFERKWSEAKRSAAIEAKERDAQRAKEVTEDMASHFRPKLPRRRIQHQRIEQADSRPLPTGSFPWDSYVPDRYGRNYFPSCQNDPPWQGTIQRVRAIAEELLTTHPPCSQRDAYLNDLLTTLPQRSEHSLRRVAVMLEDSLETLSPSPAFDHHDQSILRTPSPKCH